MMKRVLSLVLALCMMFSLGITAFADDAGNTPAEQQDTIFIFEDEEEPTPAPEATQTPEATQAPEEEEPAEEPVKEARGGDTLETGVVNHDVEETGTTTDTTVRTVELSFECDGDQINAAISSALGVSSTNGWQYKTGVTQGNVFTGKEVVDSEAYSKTVLGYTVTVPGYTKVNRDVWAPVGGGTGRYRETQKESLGKYKKKVSGVNLTLNWYNYNDEATDRDYTGSGDFPAIIGEKVPDGTQYYVRKTDDYTEADGNGTIYTIKIKYVGEDISNKAFKSKSVTVSATFPNNSLDLNALKYEVWNAVIADGYRGIVGFDANNIGLTISNSNFSVNGNGDRVATQSDVNIHFDGDSKNNPFDVKVSVTAVDARQKVTAKASFDSVIPTVNGDGSWNYDAIRAGVVKSITGLDISELSGIEILYFAYNGSGKYSKYVELEGRTEYIVAVPVNYKALQETGEGDRSFQLTFNGNANYQPFSGEFTVNVSDSRRELPVYENQTTVFAYTDSGSIDYATIKDNVVKAIWGEIPGSYSIKYLYEKEALGVDTSEYFALDENKPLTKPGKYKFEIVFGGSDTVKPKESKVYVTLQDTRTDISGKFAMVEAEGYTAISILARNSNGTITWTGLKDEILDTMWTEKGTAIPVSRDKISVTDYAINDITKTVNSDYPNGVVYTYSQNVKVTFAGNKDYKPFEKTINNLIIVDPRAVLLARNASADIVYKADGSIDTAATRTAMIQAALGKTSGIPEGLTVSVNDGDFSAVTGPGEYTLKFTYAGDATYTIMTPNVDTAVVTIGDSRGSLADKFTTGALTVESTVTTGLESAILAKLWKDGSVDGVSVTYTPGSFAKSGDQVTASVSNITVAFAGNKTLKPYNQVYSGATVTIKDGRTVVSPATGKSVDITYKADGTVDVAATKASIIGACFDETFAAVLTAANVTLDKDITGTGSYTANFTFAGNATYAPLFGTGADSVAVTLTDARTDISGSFKTDAVEVKADLESGLVTTNALQQKILTAMWTGEDACPLDANAITVTYTSTGLTYAKVNGKVVANAGNVKLSFAGNASIRPIDVTLATLTIEDPRTVVTPTTQTVNVTYNTDGTVNSAATLASVLAACVDSKVNATVTVGEEGNAFTTITAAGEYTLNFSYAGDGEYAPLFGTGADSVAVTLNDNRKDTGVQLKENNVFIVTKEGVDVSKELWANVSATDEDALKALALDYTYDANLTEQNITVTVSVTGLAAYKPLTETVIFTADILQPCENHTWDNVNHVCTRCREDQPTYVVSVTSKAYTNGVEADYTVANLSLELANEKDGRAYADTNATVGFTTVPDGYRFLGWFVNGTKIADTLSATFSVSEESKAIAKFEALQKITLTTDNEQVSVKANGATVTSKSTAAPFTFEVNAGDSIEMAYVGIEGSTALFSNWVNSSDKIIGTQSVLSFKAVTSQLIRPVFTAKEDAGAVVRFVTAYDQIIQSSTWTKDSTDCTVPAASYQAGYTFTGWTLDGEKILGTGDNGTEEATNDKVIADIKAAITEGVTELTVKPVYVKDNSTVTVTVIYVGIDKDEVEVTVDKGERCKSEVDAEVTVETPEEDAGVYKFMYWADSADTATANILGYQTDFTVYPTVNTTLYAVYAKDSEKTEAKPCLNNLAKEAVENGDKYVLTVTASYNVPEGYKVLENGFLYGTKAKLSALKVEVDEVGTEDGIYSLVFKSNNSSGNRLINLTTSYPDRLFSFRAYVIVENPDGARQVYYAPVVTYCANDVLPKT